MEIRGKVWKYGDDVNTDVIYPGRYAYHLLSEEEIASHALEDLDEDFAKQMQKGDIVVGGQNWGVGSAREQAVKTLKYKGVSAIIAKSFARIYFRNCLNEGVLAITCPEAVDAIEKGDTITIDIENSKIQCKNGAYPFAEYPEYVKELVASGGIVPYTRQKLAEKGTSSSSV